MTDTISPTGDAVRRMTCVERELATAVEIIAKRRADAEWRRAELRVAEFVAPWGGDGFAGDADEKQRRHAPR